jgi:hypothetical protein
MQPLSDEDKDCFQYITWIDMLTFSIVRHSIPPNHDFFCKLPRHPLLYPPLYHPWTYSSVAYDDGSSGSGSQNPRTKTSLARLSSSKAQTKTVRFQAFLKNSIKYYIYIYNLRSQWMIGFNFRLSNFNYNPTLFSFCLLCFNINVKGIKFRYH